MRKLVAFVLVVTAVAGGLFLLNMVVGAGVAYGIKQAVEQQNANPSHPVSVRFDDLEVNPALLKVTIDDLYVRNTTYQSATEARTTTAELTYVDALRLLGAWIDSDPMAEPVHPSMVFEDVSITSLETGQVTTSDHVRFNFAGSLKQADSLIVYARLPTEPVSITAELRGVTLDSAVVGKIVNFDGTMRDALTRLDNIYAGVTFVPDSGRVNLSSLMVGAQLLDLMVTNGHLLYSGQTLYDLSLQAVTAEMDLELHPEGIVFQPASGGTRLELDGLSLHTEARPALPAETTGPLLPKGTASLSITNLRLYPGSELPFFVNLVDGILNLETEPISIDRLSVQYAYDDELTVTEGQVNGQLADATFDGVLSLNPDRLRQSTINHMRVRIGNIVEPAETLFEVLGKLLTDFEPRSEVEVIRLSVSGPLSDPVFVEVELDEEAN